MSKRVLYVGGLSDATSDHQLRDLLETYGVVARAYVVRHKHSGKSAGYGFVEMGSGEQALSAVVALGGTHFDGHCLRLYVTPYVSTHSSAPPLRQEETHR
jgi:RNA recognition motif-containing protein